MKIKRFGLVVSLLPLHLHFVKKEIDSPRNNCLV